MMASPGLLFARVRLRSIGGATSQLLDGALEGDGIGDRLGKISVKPGGKKPLPVAAPGVRRERNQGYIP